MKYILKTEVNGSGNKVFSKQRNGKVFVYLAKDENGNIGQVDKNWILRNQANIVNLGVSGDNIYPTEIKKETTKAAVHTAPQVVEEDDDEIDVEDVLDFAERFYKSNLSMINVDCSDIYVNYRDEYACLYIEKYIDMDGLNCFNIPEVIDRISDTVDNLDVFEEAGLAVQGNRISRDNIEAIYDMVNSAKEAKKYLEEKVSELYKYSEEFKNKGFTQEQLEYCANEIDFEEWYDKTI